MHSPCTDLRNELQAGNEEANTEKQVMGKIRQDGVVWHEFTWHREGMARDGGQRYHASDVTCMSHPHLWELLAADTNGDKFLCGVFLSFQ